MDTHNNAVDASVAPSPPKRMRIAWPGVARRHAPARKMRATIVSFAEPLGGWDTLSVADKALVEAVAAKVIESRALSAALAAGQSINSEDSVRVSNALARLLQQLERRARALAKPNQASLGEYLAPAKREPPP